MKTVLFLATAVAAAAGIATSVADSNQIQLDRGASGLARCLQQLQTRASLLMITAHPDDEDGGLLAFASRGVGARTALLTLTRGEGGQNAVSGDLYDTLGLLRTQELLLADRYYGATQYWSSVIDYGFSKTREEALEKWDHERVLGETVRVIRMTRPLVLVSTFAGAPTDGHGNHQVAGEVAQEAFNAAADPTRFPEQIREGLQPWTPLKVYAHVPFFSPTSKGIYDYATDSYVPVRFYDYVHNRWIEGKPTTDLQLQEGALDSAAGLTFIQIGREGLSYQRTQNHGGMIPPPEPWTSEYHRYGTRVMVQGVESSPFDGIDISVNGIATLVPNAPKFLTDGVHQIADAATQAAAQYRPDRPNQIARTLADGLRLTRALERETGASIIAEPNKSNVQFELRAKELQFQEALIQALGLHLDAMVAPEHPAAPSPFRGLQPTFTMAIPGQTFSVQARLGDFGSEPIHVSSISVEPVIDRDWTIHGQGAPPADVQPGSVANMQFRVAVPQDATLSRPYFYRPDEEQPYYTIEDPRWKNLSYAPNPLRAEAQVDYAGQRLTLDKDVETVKTSQIAGAQTEPLLVGPAISVWVQPRAGAVPLSAHSFQFSCTVHSNVKGPANGVLRLQLPDTWHADPAEYTFNLAHDNDNQAVTFTITPANLKSGAYEIKAVAEFGGKSFAEGYRMVGYPGVRDYPFYQPATYKAVAMDVAVAPGLHVGFIPGTGDDVPRGLSDLNVPVTVIDTHQLAQADLSRFDAIVIGVRAYSVDPELRAANNRLLEYVQNGGTLIVQYNQQRFDENYGPYPFDLGPNPAKVVDESSAVEVLTADNPVLNWPNHISARDFTGWQEERGHGFAERWDAHYAAPFSMHDPNQPAQKGGLLVTRYGKGVYVYDALALYRQLPAGVPGAYRVLANLVSAGKNPNWK